MNPLKFLTVFKSGRIGRTDLGVLKVAFMVAALDGEVTENEYQTFELLAKSCRGYTPKAAADALKGAMRSAGYLLLLSRRAKEAELVKEFVAEAQAALPNGFAYSSIEDVRRAVVLWIAMGLSDGDYSARERKCVEALRKHFAELKVSKALADEACWRALAQDNFARNGVLDGCPGGYIELVPRDFVREVENLVAQYGDSRTAAKALKDLIAGK